jgi:hypothetical protein
MFSVVKDETMQENLIHGHIVVITEQYCVYNTGQISRLRKREEFNLC